MRARIQRIYADDAGTAGGADDAGAMADGGATGDAYEAHPRRRTALTPQSNEATREATAAAVVRRARGIRADAEPTDAPAEERAAGAKQSAVELVKRRRQLLVRESQEALTADDLHNVDEFSLKCAYKQHQKQLRARDVKEHRRWVILGAP